MVKKEIGYNEAISEVEAILNRLNTEQTDVDKLAAEVGRAAELIAVCKDKLRRAEQDVARVVQKEPEA
jgi:exodeoxyribonuclease VII small subunit